MTKQVLFREVNVWERIDEGRIAVYRCLELLPDGKYCVQSKDFFYAPIQEDAKRSFGKQFLELLSEQAPGRKVYDTLEEALRRHDEDFAWAAALEK